VFLREIALIKLEEQISIVDPELGYNFYSDLLCGEKRSSLFFNSYIYIIIIYFPNKGKTL
jgi:hypothetical protein